MVTTVRVDSKGRVVLPRRIREALGVQPGDTFYLEQDPDGVLRLAKGANPFEALARHAIEEYRAGRTWGLRELAQEEGLNLDDDD